MTAISAPLPTRPFRRALRAPSAVAAVFVLAALALAAMLAPMIAPYDPADTDLLRIGQPPGDGHLLGTDPVGRDILSRTIFGARASMLAALVAVGVAVGIGLPLGLAAGYLRGPIDAAITRVTDALMTVPPLILALAVVAVLGPGLTKAMLAVGLIFAPTVLRVVRASTIDVSSEPHIEASRSIGCTHWRIALVHVLPNTLGPTLVIASIMLGSAVIVESALSFLGLGVQAPTPSWGGMLAEASRRLDLQYLVWPPGVAIVAMVTACTILGDALRDALNRGREADG